MRHIKLPAIFDRYARRKDRSYSLTFNTSLEVAKEQREAIDEMWQTEGWMIFVPNEAKEVEIPKEQAEVGDKPRSVRLRNVLYRLWEAKYQDSFPEFTTFYNSKMDEWIENIKERLP